MRIRARLQRYFVTGFFTVIPFGLSALIVWWIVSLVDNALAPVVWAVTGRVVPGLGLAVALFTVLAAGWLTTNVFGERLLVMLEGLFLHIPVFKWFYGAAKQATEAFSPHKKDAFKSVVFVEYPRPGVFSMGFVTGETVLDKPDGSHAALASVYVPSNHVYIGEIVLVPKERLHHTDMTVQEGIKAALAAGAGLPERVKSR
ncbi:MAG: DUF502 domain-containing protein [Elusimicrobiota bacterium]|nr:DUF502 domain-containing protein [Elusimicrobiota bacterium]